MSRVFVADKLAPEGIAALEEYPSLEVDFSPGLEIEEAITHAREADAIIVRSATKMRGELLQAATKLKVIGRAGIGVDNIDLDAATERGIVVLNTPDANATTTAELAIAHMFSLSRMLTQADQSVRNGEWQPAKFVGSEITGKIIGIIGFGTIGRLVAERASALKMTVLGFDPFVTEETFAEYGVESREVDVLVSEADYITLHCPANENTRNIINRERLSLMKPGARLINCARGGLIDEQALLEAIESGHLAGAALDVFAQEPPQDSPLFAHPQVTFTPHLGASTREAQAAVGTQIAHQIAAFLERGEVINSVNVPSISPEKLAQLEPYMKLGRKLGRLLCKMADGPITDIEIGVFGAAAVLDRYPITVAVLTGLLEDHLSVPINHVNAAHLARRQGIKTTEVCSTETSVYVSSLRIKAVIGDDDLLLEGVLFDGRHPRLVRINDYEIEVLLEGQLLFTRHADQPGVVGALGEILGAAGINISRMQVGIEDNTDQAVAVIGISDALESDVMEAVRNLSAVLKVLQIEF